MSLIDEALKRAQAADQNKSHDADRPWTPTPLPEKSRRTRLGIVVLSIAAVVSLTAAVFLYLNREARESRAPISRASLALRASSSAAGLPPITSEVTVAPPPAGVISGPPSRVRRADDSSIPASPTRAPARVQPGVSSRVSSASAAVVTTPAGAAKEPSTLVGEMGVPGGGKISLEGIAYSETNPVAVLNGKIVPVGGYVEGFVVTSILPDRVELEAEGKKVFLKLH